MRPGCLAPELGCPRMRPVQECVHPQHMGVQECVLLLKVKGIGSGYWRVVGTAEELIEKAKTMGQSWLCGIGLARLIQR